MSGNYSTLCNENCASATQQKTFDYFDNLGLDWYQTRGKWPSDSAIPCDPVVENYSQVNYVTLKNTTQPSKLSDPLFSKNVAQFVSTPLYGTKQMSYLAYNY